MPGIGNTLEAIKGTIGALVPLVVASVAVLVVAAGTLGGRGVDLVFREGAVAEAIRRAVASAAARPVLDADGCAVELGEGAGVKSASYACEPCWRSRGGVTYTVVSTARVASVEICILAVRWGNTDRALIRGLED